MYFRNGILCEFSISASGMDRKLRKDSYCFNCRLLGYYRQGEIHWLHYQGFVEISLLVEVVEAFLQQVV